MEACDVRPADAQNRKRPVRNDSPGRAALETDTKSREDGTVGTTRVELEVTINRPVQEVFAFFVDPALAGRWQTAVAEAEQITEGPVGVGTRFRVIRNYLGRRLESTEEVIEYVPNRTFALRALSSPIPYEARSTFEEVDGATRIVASVQGDASGFFMAAGPVLARVLKREMESNLGHLKDLLEARA